MMAEPSLSELRRLGAWAHHLLLVLLVALRPLIWDGDSGSPAALAWYILMFTGLAIVAGEVAAGARGGWRWGWSGLVALALTLLLLPAALRSPQGFEGLALWGMIAGHLAFAAYLMQVMPGRERLALGALLAGLAGETLYALGQYGWVLPDLARRLHRGELAAQIGPGMAGEFAERIANGGIYGSFTLSNTLAGFLLLTIPLAAAALRPAPLLARGLAAMIGLGGLAVLVLLTNSKGGIAALALAVVVVAIAGLRGRWRWIAPLAAVALLAVALGMPRVRDGLAASAEVRVGYWQAATTLIAERPLSGHGVGSFATESARALPIGAEYSRQVHNEPLEAAVDAGVAAGLALLALLILLARSAAPADSGPVARQGLAGLALVIAVPYLHLFGMLSFAGWPASPADLHLVWSLLLGIVLAGTVWGASLLPPPPAWALRLALAAAGLHALIDFDLHSGGVVGTLVVIAVLAGQTRGRVLPMRAALRAVPGVMVVLGIALLAWGGHRGLQVTEARELSVAVREVEVARGAPGDRLRIAAADLAYRLGRGEPTAAELSPPRLAELSQAGLERAWDLASARPVADAATLTSIIALTRPGRARLGWSTRAVELHPHNALAHLLLAEDFAAAGDWREAIACASTAVGRSPWHLPYRQELVRFLEQGAAASADPALLDQIVSEREQIRALDPRVHVRDRARARPEPR